MNKYSSYKNLNITWLKIIPSHWETKQLKYITNIKLGYAFNSNDFTNEGIPVLRIGDIEENGSINFFNAKHLPNEAARAFKKALIMQGDIVMAMTGATIGKVGKYIYSTPAVLNQRVCSFKVKPGNYQLYLWYLLKADFYFKYINLVAFGGAQPNISDSALLQCLVPNPNLAEQIAIADFLDHETSKIDALISKQQKLIALFTEKRQAIISHAVTKGLDADVPMKDSGIAWLGEIPSHWEIKRLKSIFKLITNKTNHHTYRVGLENIESWSGKFIDTNSEFEGDGIAFEAKDILFGKLRPYLAKVFLAPQEGEAVGDFHILRTKNQEIQEKFFVYKLLDFNLIKLITSATFGAKMPRVSWDFMANLSIAFPSSSEQLKIATFLDQETSKIDKLIIEVNRAIELLKERRTALISAAVTGKIDVRDITSDLPMESSPDVQFTPGTTL